MAEIEKIGIPTVGLISAPFEENFKASAKVFGVSWVPYVVVSERALILMQATEIQRRVEPFTDTVVEKLTNPSIRKGEAYSDQVVSLTKALFGLEVPEREVFEGADRLEAWERMDATFLERNWGDGFPLVPPTTSAVARMLAGTRRSPQDVVTVLEPAFGIATVEKIAINAVMARCKPEHLRVLIAAVEAISDPIYELRHVAMSTGPLTPMLVVNGPIAKRIGMNSGMGCLGPGKPAAVNTAIGRALRLIMMNIGGAYVGVMDVDTIGDSNKYSMCLAENEEANPWEPLHVERGYDRNDSTVTAFSAYSSINFADHYNTEPAAMLRRLARIVCNPGEPTISKWMARPDTDVNSKDLKPADYEGECVIVLCPNHARLFGLHSWSKVGVKEVLHLFAKLPISVGPGSYGAMIKRFEPGVNARVRPEWAWAHAYPELEVPAFRTPECINIIVAGADSQKSMVVLGGRQSVTRKIET